MRTGRPSFLLRSAEQISSGVVAALPPNPPPTAGRIIRIFPSGTAITYAIMYCT